MVNCRLEPRRARAPTRSVAGWSVLALVVAAGAARTRARWAPAAAGTTPFDADTVATLARDLAAKPFAAQSKQLPASLEKIGYDQYRGIRFNPAQALWREKGLPFQAQFFHRGFFFRDRVDIYAVAGGMATPVVYKPAQFTFDGTHGTEGKRPRLMPASACTRR